MFLPKRINVRRKAAWFDAKGEVDDMSPADAQVWRLNSACCICELRQHVHLRRKASDLHCHRKTAITACILKSCMALTTVLPPLSLP